MKSRLKAALIRLRNQLSPSNTFKVSGKANFTSEANILNTQIQIEPHNTVHIKEGVYLRNLKITIRGEGNELIIHKDAFIMGEIELFGNNNRIEIGKSSRLVGVFVGAHNGTQVTIGEYCMMAAGTDIRTTDSHPIFNSEGEHINPDKNILIHDRVWLAKGVDIMKGSEIESDSVIGTRSLVSGFVAKNTIAAGIPARVIKTGITWSRQYPPEGTCDFIF